MFKYNNEIETFKYYFNNLNDHHPKDDNVEGLNIELRNNQKTTLYHCKILERNNGIIIKNLKSENNYHYCNEDQPDYLHLMSNMGCLGCKVGSGKSFVVLGLILSKSKLFFERTLSYRNTNACCTFKIVSNEKNTLNSNIILIPHNLFTQWKTYINEKTNITNLISFSTKKEYETFKNILNDIKENKENHEIYEQKINEHIDNKLFLISSKMWNYFCSDYQFSIKKKTFSRLFIDEVHSINIPNCRGIDANFIWFVTSSLKDMELIRNVGFIRDNVNSFFSSNFNYYLTVKCTDEYVEASQNLPQPIYEVIKCRTHMIMNIFEGVLTQDVREMLAAEDIEGVVNALGIEQVNEANIISKLCSNLENDLHNARENLKYKINKVYVDMNSKECAINNAKDKIKEIEQKIQDVRDRIMQCDLDPITHCEIDNPVITPCCNNKFDLQSMTTYYDFEFSRYKRVNCPLCRLPLDIKKMIYLGDNIPQMENLNISDEFITENHTKIENLKNLLTDIDENKKILIFSEHEGNFNMMAECFREKGRFDLTAVKGQRTHIDNIIMKYTNGEIKSLFLNARFNASGFNLQMTDIIIIMHKMSSDTLKQIVGRAQRIGRTTQLKVYQFVGTHE